MPELLLSLGAAAAALAVALGCGLLVGIERERRKGSGPGRALAGVRSFAVAALMGATTMLVGQLWLTVVGAAFVAALAVVAYRRDRSGDPGVTTELALLLTFVIGALCTLSLTLGAALAVTLTGLLAGRERMHDFARHWLQPAELRDGIVLAALALIALPLLPDRPLWGLVLNPRTIATLLVVLLAIQALAHLCRRVLRERQALMLSALASGFVSSTATIATLGMEVRADKTPARLAAGAALLSCVATLLQLLAVAATVQPSWLTVLWLPVLAGAGVAGLLGAWMVRSAMAHTATPDRATAPSVPDPQRMFSLPGAALVAALLTGVQAAVQGLTAWLGDTGLLAATLIAALAELHAASAAVMAQSPAASGPAFIALGGALAVHALAKCVTAQLSGGWAFASALAPGLLGHTALVLALLFATSG
ncbi:MAG: MgtC/SapB family protein [Ramlibacter sp.]|nr:MgtC/SapB family protein [Ramlibacter sp.]